MNCENEFDFSDSLELMISHAEFVRLRRVPEDQRGPSCLPQKIGDLIEPGTGLLSLLINWVILMQPATHSEPFDTVLIAFCLS